MTRTIGDGQSICAAEGATDVGTHSGATQQGDYPCGTYRPPHEVFIPGACFQRRKADLREDVLLTCRISSIHRYTSMMNVRGKQEADLVFDTLVRVTPSSAKYGYSELPAKQQIGYGSRSTVIPTPNLGPWTNPYMKILDPSFQIADENLVDMEYADMILIFKKEEKAYLFLDELTSHPVLWHPPCTHEV
ncbi:hypothetical protein CLF_106358 [Clonorchis sinensis]|uniref:Uncharacterized protein n=1 Tax=Clonorchis sinensis TaxID=79923 RepID=G7YF13_CLOSI|nr:hypothetical protein CLF_106358 [Clonorchis sinensis]